MGHAWATRQLGGIVDRIVLWPLGGFCVFGPSRGSTVSEDLWVTAVGPLTHIFQAAIWTGIYAAVEKGDFSGFTQDISLSVLRRGGATAFVGGLCVQAIVFNCAIVVANIAIPAYPFDGGRALVALLVMGEFKVTTAARITSVMGVLVGLMMLFVGVFLYAAKTSAGGLFLAFIAAFVINSALQMWKAARVGRLYEYPLFRLECYRSMRRRTGTSSPQASPAATRNQVPINSHIV